WPRSLDNTKQPAREERAHQFLAGGARLVPSRSGHASESALEWPGTNSGCEPAAEWDAPRSEPSPPLLDDALKRTLRETPRRGRDLRRDEASSDHDHSKRSRALRQLSLPCREQGRLLVRRASVLGPAYWRCRVD